MNALILRELYENFSIIPVKKNKSPDISTWKKYQTQKIDFTAVLNKEKFGVVCGYDNLEVIDIDNHFSDAYQMFNFIKDNIDLSKYFIVETQGKGYHIYYKCAKCERNQKLASRINDKGRPETLIETRGVGGYVVFYEIMINGKISEIPTITQQERKELLTICRSLNEVEKNNNSTQKADQGKPGDAYNSDLSNIKKTIDILKSAGWSSTNDIHFKRPGKDTAGISATFGKVGINKFYVFSSNCYPFEADTSYSMFAVKTMIEFNGDYSACAKSLLPHSNLSVKEKDIVSEALSRATLKNDKWQVLQDVINDWDLKFRYNEITKVLDVSIKGKPYSQLGLLPGDIIREMEVKRGIKTISMSKLMEMINNSSICKIYNPIIEFIRSIPKWNGKDAIKELCSYFQLHESESVAYFESMFKKHLIRTLKGATNPEYVNRMVFVLHGPQEIGKSWFFRWLIPSELYNEEPINPTDKDSILALTRYLLINMEELDSLNKKDVSKLKAFVSRGNITKRVAYGKHDEQFNRVASFVANTNKLDLLTDDSNTRWLIMQIKGIDWVGYTKEIDNMQIWAQALHELKADNNSGELTKEEKDIREMRNNKIFLEMSQERELLQKYFKEGFTLYNATEIKLIIEKNLYPLKVNNFQLTRELRRLFGEPIMTRKDGVPGRYYQLTCIFTSAIDYSSYYEVEKDMF